MYQTATALGSRPSSLLGLLSNDWIAYQFDCAIVLGGRMVENVASRTDKNGKPLRTVEDILKHGIQRQGTLEQLIAMFGTD
jgi:hypothetical protein